jgi:tetratricopeptide (TPR) repeat protein
MPLSIQMYERAVEEDPGFALAFSRLSIAHGQMYWFGFDQTESRLKMAEEAVERALAVAPDLPAAHLALGYYYYRGFRNYDKALREFDVAEQATPPDSELFEARGYIYKRLGEWDRSLESTSRAIELDPRNANLFYQQASTYGIRRDYVSAEEHLERVLEIAPDNVGAYTMKAQIPLRRDGNTVLLKAAAENPPIQIGIKRQWLGWYAAIYERNFDTALKYLDSWNIDVYEEQWECVPKSSFYGVTYNLAKRPELAEPKFRASRMQIEAKLKTDPNDPRLYIALGEVLAGTDESEAAIRAVHRAMNLLPTSTDAFDGPVYRLATIIRVLVPAGDHDGAIEELDAYLAEPGRWSIEGLLPDPRLDPIRDEPRFHVLVEKYKR